MEALTHTSTLVAVTFSEDTRITALSSTMENAAGYTNDEMIGRPVTHVLADETVFEMPKILDTVRGEGRWTGEIIFRSRDNRPVNAGAVITLLSGRCGQNAEYLLLSGLGDPADSVRRAPADFSDVGHRVREFVHDLNNPLTVVMGTAQLLSLNADCTEKIRSDIEKLYSETERVARLVAELHSYAFSLCDRPADPNSSPPSCETGHELSHTAGEDYS